jgi:hypothetical protein
MDQDSEQILMMDRREMEVYKFPNQGFQDGGAEGEVRQTEEWWNMHE